ncbi:MAG: tRNA pseudouridine(55) synthase TruB [Planctomycetota bacterium]
MFGLINLNKPKGLTSRDAVNRVQWLVRQAEGEGGRLAPKKTSSRVGHAGTLDPIATGVLVVCLGPATRLIEHVQRQPKRYRGTFLLGRRSPSDDVELEAELLADPPVPTVADIAAALPAFVGQIEQVPPAYSAIKIKGQKAYDLARKGQRVEIAPRPVTIHGIDIVRYDYPELVLGIRCGSGAYIRALGRDLAESLGTAAVMSELVRTAIGEFHVDDAISVQDLSEDILGGVVLPAEWAAPDLPRVELSAGQVVELRHGRPVDRPVAGDPPEIVLMTPDGDFFGLGKIGRAGKLWPVRVFDVAKERE